MAKPTFATIKQILTDLGFQANFVPGSHVLFELPGTDAWILLRPYREDDVVWEPNVVAIRQTLDGKGILPQEQFDELLRERLVAG